METVATPDTAQEAFVKLKGNQGWRDELGRLWRKDRLHKDHWDVTDEKGLKVVEVRFDGTILWPGPKNKNK